MTDTIHTPTPDTWFARRMAEIKADIEAKRGPERNTQRVRVYTCIDCRTPRSAIRKGLRCTACSELHQTERRKARPKKRTVFVEPVEQGRRKGPWYEADPDIAAYRAEKSRKQQREAVELSRVDDAIAEARALLDAESGERMVRRALRAS